MKKSDPIIPQVLFAFTLKSHYYEQEAKKVQVYNLPGEPVWLYAKTRVELQNLMNQLKDEAFPEEHRQSDGLILCVDAAKNQALVSVEGGFTKPQPGIPIAAILKDITVPRKTIHFQVPADLTIPDAMPKSKQQIWTLISTLPNIALIAALIGLAVAILPFRFGDVSSSNWLDYFLTHAGMIHVGVVAGLFALGLLLWLVMLSRLEVSMGDSNTELIKIIQNILNLARGLDPGTKKLQNRYFFLAGLMAILIAIVWANWWAVMQPLSAIQFEIREPGQDVLLLSQDQVYEIKPDSTVEFRVTLPPTVSEPFCRWSTSSKESTIYQQSGCQAVYWSRNLASEDAITVEIISSGKLLSTATITLKVK